MINKNIVDDLTEKLCGLFPEGLQGTKQSIKDNLHSALQATFEKFDLVSREEFDTQCAVLERTREKIEALEKRIQALE